MRRLAQFVRLRAFRVSRLSASASVSRLRAFVSRASRVCVHLSRVRLASVCVCSRQGFRMRASASVSRLVSRLVSLLRASVSRLSCICLRLSVSRRSSCLASRVCVRLSRVGRLVSRLSVYPCECLRELAHFMSVVIQRVQKVFCYRHTIAVHIDYVDYMNRPLIF